ncbi:MAG: hypothetical protein JWO40_234 [Candidatus Doudnabacteria bacterium]|nr:hypothetical protein [Candidatus Doudnabacteria bacterium]
MLRENILLWKNHDRPWATTGVMFVEVDGEWKAEISRACAVTSKGKGCLDIRLSFPKPSPGRPFYSRFESLSEGGRKYWTHYMNELQQRATAAAQQKLSGILRTERARVSCVGSQGETFHYEIVFSAKPRENLSDTAMKLFVLALQALGVEDWSKVPEPKADYRLVMEEQDRKKLARFAKDLAKKHYPVR